MYDKTREIFYERAGANSRHAGARDKRWLLSRDSLEEEERDRAKQSTQVVAFG